METNGRKRISTEIEEAVEVHNQSVSKLKKALEETSKTSTIDDLKVAIQACISAHHPLNETICEQCSKLYTLMQRL